MAGSGHEQRPQLSTQEWTRASVILVLTALVSKGLGLLREVVVASAFGASVEIDAFVVAAGVTTSVSGLGASVSAALVPMFRRVVVAEGSTRAASLAGGVVVVTLALSACVAVVLAAAPLEVLRVVAPDLPVGTARLAAELVRWLSVLVIAVSMFFALSGVYHAMEHFKMPALLDLSSNVFVLAVLVTLGPAIGVRALPLGLALGTLSVVVAMTVPLLARRLVSLRGGSFDRELRTVVALSAPVFLWDILWQAGQVVENFFGAGLPVGSLSALGYAKRLSLLVVSLVAVNVSRAVFPALSRLVAEGDKRQTRALLATLCRQYLLVFVPISAVLVLLSGDIVSLVFERGAFDEHATDVTSRALMFYAAGLVPAVAVPLLVRACYAFTDMFTPLLAGLVGLVALTALGALLAPDLGVAGVALASSLALVPGVGLMLSVLARRLDGLEWRDLARVAMGAGSCAAAAAVPALLADRLLGEAVAVAARVAAVGSLYVVAYVALAWMAMRPDLRDLARMLFVPSPRQGGHVAER